MFVNIAKRIHYKAWIFIHWIEKIILPHAHTFTVRAKNQILLALLIIFVSLPVNYYLFSSVHDMEAVAAVESRSAQVPQVTRPLLLSELDVQQQPGKKDDVLNSSNLAEETALDHAKKHMNTNYICPMHPEIVTNDASATCPLCGMDLVPLEVNGDVDIVTLSPTVINSLGVRTASVKQRTIYRRINSVGYIGYDENRIRTVSLRAEGWVERLVVKSVGGKVKKGDLLFEIYSPQLVNAQEEYVQALIFDSGDGVLVSASRARLKALGVSATQIAALRTEKDVKQLIQINAPQDGIVSELNITEGMFVLPSKAVISLVDLSSIWLLVDIFENQVGWVKKGQLAEASLPFMPDKVWEGAVEFVYPSLDLKTRSLKVRLRFDNPSGLLKPNMYADVTIYARPKKNALTVPREAVIQTGGQQRVIVALGEGKFQPVAIRTGVQTEDHVEIISGLEEGVRVVVSSQFLIDSESSMRASLLRLTGG